MSKMSQREAMFAAVTSVLANAGVAFEEGQDLRPLMTKELRAQVNQILFQGFRSGEIELKVEKSDKQLKSYVSGLQSNWLGKDKNLNGGVVHAIKNPGSRTGSTDPQIKALRALLSTRTDESERAEIQECIDSRLAEIQASKPSKKAKVSYSDLPAELQEKYGV